MKKKSDLKKVFKKHWKLMLLDLTAFVLLIVNLTNLAQLWLSKQDSVIIAIATLSLVLSLVTSLRANNIFFKIVREDLREINVTYVDVQEPTFLIPKKVIKETKKHYVDTDNYYEVDYYKCPCCENMVLYDRFQDITIHTKNNHCQHCGQHLDWSF